MKVRIAATASYLPEHVVTNESLTQFPPHSRPLIQEKTGVRERRHAAPGQCTSDLGFEAAQLCLQRAGISPLEVDAIILATSSPDRTQPATATRLQHMLKATNAFAFDVNSVCTGALYALRIAGALIEAGHVRTALVVASEVYSRHLNPRDFSTYPYFGDGAAAALLSAGPDGCELVASILHSDGSGNNVIQVPAGGTMAPYQSNPNPSDIYFKMIGKEVYEFAVTRGTEVIGEILTANNLIPRDIGRFILHQANINIINAIAGNLEVPLERFAVNLDRYGNTAAASVLIALDEDLHTNGLNQGEYIVIAAFGGGLSWGAGLLRRR